MSKLPKNADLDLRRLFPDVALQMDTQLILHQARELGIHPKVNKSVKLPVVRVQLTLDHEISISPVDKGAMGVAEWFTFNNQNGGSKNYPELISRVHVSIKDKLFQQDDAESFTIEAPNFEMMLRISLTIYYSITGKKLQPVARTNRKKVGGKN
jgi:hypothetical protein